jgi:hypothetical protein
MDTTAKSQQNPDSTTLSNPEGELNRDDQQKTLASGLTTEQTTGVDATEKIISGTTPSNNNAKSPSSGGIIHYTTAKDALGDKLGGILPDVFCIVDGPTTGEFKRIKFDAPTRVREKTDMENIILSGDIYSYSRSEDENKNLKFQNITSSYRLYANGYMEYNFTSKSQQGEKGSLPSALEKTIAFILDIEKPLLNSADLIISGIYENESDSLYQFTFDYILEDYPVYFKYQHEPEDTKYQHAITIQANANRVVTCNWMLVDLFFSTDTKKMQINFSKFDPGQSLTGMDVTDLSIAYGINISNEENNDEYIWPVWAITSSGGELNLVKMGEG